MSETLVEKCSGSVCIDLDVCIAPKLLDRIEALEAALRLLMADVADYPAWQRPCHALDVARAALGWKDGAPHIDDGRTKAQKV